MDEYRNITKEDSLAAIFDSDNSRVSFFGANRSAERIFGRAERICAAIHLLTNHVDRSEPVRIAVRSSSVELLDRIGALRNEIRASQSSSSDEIRMVLRRIISQLRTLTAAGSVSIQNAKILVDAIEDFATFLLSLQRSHLSESVTLSRDSFLDTQNVRESYRKPLKDIKDYMPVKDSVPIKDGVIMSDTVSNTTSRKSIILAIFTPGIELGIKEISAHIPEFSEKTIQRELVQLVLMGKVKKTGSKRWSTYSIT